MKITLKIISLIIVIAGAVIVYGSKFYLIKKDENFDLENNKDYSLNKLFKLKITGFITTIAGIVILFIERILL